MREGEFSRTAHSAAIRRAAHQLLDQPPVHDDPLALAVIGSEAAQSLRSDLQTQQTPPARALRAFLAARGRYAEDQLKLALAGGVKQYVVLGAGLDTFAFRNPHQDLRVFEVDHPATQEWKQDRLKEAGIDIPPTASFVHIDFEEQSLSAGLMFAGFVPEEPAFFSWLGVTPYIRRETCMSTLAFIAKLPHGSGIAFDFVVDPSLLDGKHLATLNTLSPRVASVGEPFQLFFQPAQLHSELNFLGFREVEMLSAEQINERYFRGRTDALKVSGSLGRLMCAWV
jgi:methyltransferase (TIGR00027 family)